MFKIGEFSRLSRVSVRMLRHYDKLGLLKPVRTDPVTGYRYYSADQLPRLNRILAYRDLDFSLQQIAGLLDDEIPDVDLLEVLKRKREQIERKILVEQSRLGRLEARIQETSSSTGQQHYDVILREIEPQLVASLRKVLSKGDSVQGMFEGLEKYVSHYKARADEPPMTIVHDLGYHENNVDTEVAVPITQEIPSSSEYRVYRLAGITQAACVVHTGGYATIYRAFNTLLTWIEANHFRMKGPVREVYLRYGADGLGFKLPPTYLVQGSVPFVTELQLSVEKVRS